MQVTIGVHCPHCGGTILGQADTANRGLVKIECPSCGRVFKPEPKQPAVEASR